jgi:uncharacterized membrane protein YfcA
MLGARIFAVTRSEWLRRIFVWVIAALALEMLYKGITRNL